MIAALYNVPSTQNELTAWSFAHMAHHRDIITRIYLLVKVALPEYVLDPIPLNDIGNWVYNHQIMHQQMDALLGIQGYDLTDVNLQDRNDLAGFIYLNANEHYQAGNILQLG